MCIRDSDIFDSFSFLFKFFNWLKTKREGNNWRHYNLNCLVIFMCTFLGQFKSVGDFKRKSIVFLVFFYFPL